MIFYQLWQLIVKLASATGISGRAIEVVDSALTSAYWDILDMSVAVISEPMLSKMRSSVGVGDINPSRLKYPRRRAPGKAAF